MARQIINIGVVANDGLGDPLRTAYEKCNTNFAELYSRVQQEPPTTAVGTPGDLAGMISIDTDPASVNFGKLYYCFQNYDGSSEIWKVLTGSNF